MMAASPLIKAFVCALGLAVAGAPLLLFTSSPPPAEAVSAPAEAAEWVEVAALLRYTGEPVEICIRYQGEPLCRLTPAPGAEGMWRGKLSLPVSALRGELELELEGVWPEPLLTRQVMTLELSPPKLPMRRDTQWAEAGEPSLHNIYSFTW